MGMVWVLPHRPLSDPLYVTTDWYLASFVLSQGVPLVGYRRIAPKRVVFSFPADPRLHGLLRLYWSVEPVLVVPVFLFEAHRRLKSHDPMSPDPLTPRFPHLP